LKLFFSYILIFLAGSTFCQAKSLSAYEMIQKIASRHLVYNCVNPRVTRRAVRLFVHQFDPRGIYLEDKEKDVLMGCSDEQISQILEDLKRGSLAFFQNRYLFFGKAIERSRWVRSKDCESAFGVSSHLANQIFRHKDDFYKNYSKILKNADPQQRLSYYNRKLSAHENKYLQSVTSETFETLVIKAFAKSLDPHTNFYSKIEAEEIKTYFDKGIQGVGISFKEKIDGAQIVELKPGGPAERSQKVLVGDYLVGVNNIRVENLEFSEALRALTLAPKQVMLTLRKADASQKETTVTLMKEPIVIESERLDLAYEPYDDGVIGKLTLYGFYESKIASSDLDIKIALRKLRQMGPIKGIILDLRYNLGGLLSQAPRVAGCFMKSGVVAIWKLAKEQKKILRELDGQTYYEGPLLVLTSKSSASCAEIVAGTLQDYGLCVIAGDAHTYGKATVQDQNATLGHSPAYRVTVGRYYTVSGRSPQLEGVISDIIVPSPYHHVQIGERFLHYALKPDSTDEMFWDAFSDVPNRKKRWFQKNYVPKMQKKLAFWHEQLPELRAASKRRIEKSSLMQDFSLTKVYPSSSDIQMVEATHILKDMIRLYEAQSP
jgi:carboxyl-terminal processing protease